MCINPRTCRPTDPLPLKPTTTTNPTTATTTTATTTTTTTNTNHHNHHNQPPQPQVYSLQGAANFRHRSVMVLRAGVARCRDVGLPCMPTDTILVELQKVIQGRVSWRDVLRASHRPPLPPPPCHVRRGGLLWWGCKHKVFLLALLVEQLSLLCQKREAELCVLGGGGSTV